jgi:hypothetical protein
MGSGEDSTGRTPTARGGSHGERLLATWAEGTLTLELEGRRRIVVGRGTDATLVLPITGLSRAHFALERAGRGWLVEDLGSRNGTFVAGARLASGERRRLSAAETITAAGCTFVVAAPQRARTVVGARVAPREVGAPNPNTEGGILDALRRAHGNQRKAAELLGIARATLFRRMKAFGIPGPRGANDASGKVDPNGASDPSGDGGADEG